jgi:hypothetical protein
VSVNYSLICRTLVLKVTGGAISLNFITRTTIKSQKKAPK